jgi:hypothetical protein
LTRNRSEAPAIAAFAIAFSSFAVTTPTASHSGDGRGATSTPNGGAGGDAGDAAEVDAKADDATAVVPAEVVPAVAGWFRPACPA